VGKAGAIIQHARAALMEAVMVVLIAVEIVLALLRY
jgi:hypothetical protein